MEVPSRRLTIMILAAILLGSTLLRFHQYDQWPRKGATFDEFAWTWLGMSILETGMPQSWSYHPQYTYRHAVKIGGADFVLVTPYLEHPPLFGLVAGSFALLTGQRTFASVDLSRMRVLSVSLGVLSVGLVFWLGTLLYGRTTGLLAAFLYGIIPTVAVGSRLVQNENFFIPLWLSMLIALWYYLKRKKTILRTVAAVTAGLLILAKVPWAAAAVSAAAILWFKKLYKDAWWVFFVAIAIGFLYVLYGLYMDRTVFAGLMGLQLNRYDISFDGMYSLWLKPLLTDRYYLDGWIYFGWASLLLLSGNVRKHWFLLLAVCSYFLLFIIAIPDEPGHGWYRYPFYPFLMIAGAVAIREYLSVNPFYRFFALLAVGLPLLACTWGPAFGFSYGAYRLYILWAFLSFLPYIWRGAKSAKFSDWAYYVQASCCLLLTLWATLVYNEM